MTTAAKRILFVDDEEHVLEGLRNLFRRQRHVWDMVFVTSGEAALVELEKAPFDVIVSDMRMPGMDGATLLLHVKSRYPSVVRIVLSGHAERAAMVRALSVAHQFLSKPCEADTLTGCRRRRARTGSWRARWRRATCRGRTWPPSSSATPRWR
jgi:DNA-binding NtrC family response regulator